MTRYGKYPLRLSWIDTAEGREILHAKRSMARAYLAVEIEPRSKRTISEQEKLLFFQAVEQALRGRRGFRSLVAVDLLFCSSAENPPEIQTLTKNYVDLLYKSSDKSNRMFKDDRQIGYLSARYVPEASGRPLVAVTTGRLSSFKEDVRLAHSLREEQGSNRDYDDYFDDPLEQFKSWKADRKFLIAQLGEDSYKAHLNYLLMNAQMSFLENTKGFLHRLLLSTYGQRNQSKSGLFSNEIRNRILLSPGISTKLAHLPQRSGEGKEFKAAVDVAIGQIRRRRPLLFPLLCPLSVMIFYVPPEHEGIDLDNLARKIIPSVNQILRPPSRIRFSTMEENYGSERLPKHHITGYEVFMLPRGSGDHVAGTVHLALCSGLGQNFTDFVDGTIEHKGGRFSSP